MRDLLKSYREKSGEIKVRLDEFRNLSEGRYFGEFLFCLLTPQSNAQKSWAAVEEILTLEKPTEQEVFRILKIRTRFHKTKTTRVLKAFSVWSKIKEKLSERTLELRNWLADNVNGYGLKEASHFLRNIGKSNNQIAILDRHILKNLCMLGLIVEPRINSRKRYLEIEEIYLDCSRQLGILPDELDLLWWSQENGEIFK